MKRRMTLLGVCLLITVLGTGCGLLGGAQLFTQSDHRSQIEQTLQLLAAAGEAKDISVIKSHVANEIVAQLSGSSDTGAAGVAPQSVQDIAGLVQELWEEKSFDRIVPSPITIQVNGDTAYVEGQFLIEYTDRAQGKITCSGAGNVSLSKINGEWVVTHVNVTEGECTNEGSNPHPGPSPGPEDGEAPKTHFETCDYFIVGQTDDQVKGIQTSLNFLGYDAGLVDGYYGPKTKQAVTNFQTDAGVYVDGEFGPETIGALNQALVSKGGYFICESTTSRPDEPPTLPGSQGTKLTEGFLMEGTSYETKVLTYQSQNPGPTLVFVGCIHGNERSGYLALEDAIDRGISISRGRVVIVPEFNRNGCEDGRRTYNGNDFNRLFPVGETPKLKVGRAMWDLVKSQPDLAFVVDFHDGFNHSLANTLIHSRDGESERLADEIRDALNDIRPSGSNGPKWRSFSEPIGGSLTRKVGRDLDIPAMEVETAGRTNPDSLSLRKEYVWTVVRMVGEAYDIDISF